MTESAPTRALVVLISLPADGGAAGLGHDLVAAGLAACVHELPVGRSIYRWKDQVETAPESLLVVKTTAAAYPALEAAVMRAHPYDLPEIVALPIVEGLPAYLAWLTDAVTDPS